MSCEHDICSVSQDKLKVMDKATAEIILFILKQQGINGNVGNQRQVAEVSALVAMVTGKIFASVRIQESDEAADALLKSHYQMADEFSRFLAGTGAAKAYRTNEECEQMLQETYGPKAASGSKEGRY